MNVSAIIPTHNPHPERLQRTLRALAAQTLPASAFEILIVDNASQPPVSEIKLQYDRVAPRVINEPRLGLTAARQRGIDEARAGLCVLIDDDNLLAPNYLAEVRAHFTRLPQLGAAGGRSLPEFATAPAEWQREFFGLLALRDLGGTEKLASTSEAPGRRPSEYPACAPIGAGMALRRDAALDWIRELAQSSTRRGLDRTGAALVSGGDNDIVLTLLRCGWSVGYFPSLELTHLIPASRLHPHYLARLNRAIQRSWIRVLELHGINPWPPIPRWTVPLRQARAFLRTAAWLSPAHRIRWQGLCGHFEGQADIAKLAA